MQHPFQAQRDAQEKLLQSLPDEDRPFHQRMFRIGNASFCYYHNNDTTEEDYLSWLDGLQELMKSDMAKKGFEACRNILSLQRHSLELKDLGYDEFMKSNLSEDDYSWWSSTKTL